MSALTPAARQLCDLVRNSDHTVHLVLTITASISASENSRCCQRYDGASQSSKSAGFDDSLYRGMAPAIGPDETEAPAADENFFRKSSNEAWISLGARGWTAGLAAAGVS